VPRTAADYFCAVDWRSVPTVTSGFSFRKFFSPIPLTFMSRWRTVVAIPRAKWFTRVQIENSQPPLSAALRLAA
jgi:hypothetical protein